MIDVYVFGLVVGIIVALAGMWILWQYAPEWIAMRLFERSINEMDLHYAKVDGVKKDPVEPPTDLPLAYPVKNYKGPPSGSLPIKYPTDADVKATKKAAKDLQAFAAKKKATPKKTKATPAKKKALTAKKKTSKRA